MAGGTAAWGADPLSTPRPLGPLHDVALDVPGPLARLLGDGAPAHEVVAALLAGCAERSGFVVFDDLQWADEATVDLLGFLVRRVESTRSVGAGHPLRTFLGDAARSRATTRLRLRPLSIDALTTMVGPAPSTRPSCTG